MLISDGLIMVQWVTLMVVTKGYDDECLRAYVHSAEGGCCDALIVLVIVVDGLQVCQVIVPHLNNNVSL